MKSLRLAEDILPIGEFKAQASSVIRKLQESIENSLPCSSVLNGEPGPLAGPRAPSPISARSAPTQRDSPGTARHWIARLRDRAHKAALHPAAGGIDGLTVFEGHRSFPVDVGEPGN